MRTGPGNAGPGRSGPASSNRGRPGTGPSARAPGWTRANLCGWRRSGCCGTHLRSEAKSAGRHMERNDGELAQMWREAIRRDDVVSTVEEIYREVAAAITDRGPA